MKVISSLVVDKYLHLDMMLPTSEESCLKG